MGLDITGIGTLASVAGGIIDKFFPDKTAEQKAQFAAELTALQGQLDANKAEAASNSLWVAGWRPFVGWICGAALGMIYIPKALLMCIIWSYQSVVIVSHWSGTGPIPPLPVYPDLGVSDLIMLLGTLLGMGSLRSFDKQQGTGNGH